MNIFSLTAFLGSCMPCIVGSLCSGREKMETLTEAYVCVMLVNIVKLLKLQKQYNYSVELYFDV